MAAAAAPNRLFPPVSDVNQRELHRLTDSTRDAIAWCRDQGLLATEMECTACGGEMLEGADQKRNGVKINLSNLTDINIY